MHEVHAAHLYAKINSDPMGSLLHRQVYPFSQTFLGGDLMFLIARKFSFDSFQIVNLVKDDLTALEESHDCTRHGQQS